MSSSPIAGLIPGSNVSGNTIMVPYGPQQGGQASLGGSMNPFLPITATGTGTSMPMLPQGAVSTSATSGFPAYSGGYSPSSLLSTGSSGGSSVAPNNPTAGSVPINSIAQGLGLPSTTQGQQQLWDTLSKTYGAGFATAFQNFLASGAGFNQTAVNNLIAAMQPGFTQDQNSLIQAFSQGGNRFSSGAQTGLADLMSQQQLDVGQLETQMYEQSVSDYLDVLMGTGSQSASRIMSQQGGGLSGLMSLISGAGSGLSAAGVGGSSGTLSSIISGLAAA